MNALSIATVIIASISLYVGLYHLFIYLRRRQRREDLTFALMCLATSLYGVFCTGLYNADSIAEGVQWQRAQYVALTFFITTFLWFVSDYTRQKSNRTISAFSVFALLAVLIQIVDRSTLTWMIDRPSIKEILLPFGIKITYYEAALGPFSMFQGLMGLAAGTYIVWCGVRFYRRGYKREARPLLFALGFMYAAVINDTAVSYGLYNFVYVIEYAYLVMILLMAYSFSNTIVEAAMVKDALLESEHRFRTLAEASFEGLGLTKEGILLDLNDQLAQMLGYQREELLGTPVMNCVAPEHRALVAEFIANGRLEPYEHLALRKDGTHFLVEVRARTIRIGDHNIRVSAIRDITECKQAEAELYESRLMLQMVLDTIPVRVFWKNRHSRFLGCNVSFALDAGFSEPRDLVGKDDYELGEREMAECYRRDDRQVIESGVPKLNYEELQVRPNGDHAWLRTSKLPLRDARGGIQGVLVIYEDITEHKRVEAEHEALIQNLEAKNYELERFTYTVSHDLKSPLVTVKGFLGFLEQDAANGDTARLQRDVQHIHEAVDTMQQLLNDLLELSRIGRIVNPPQKMTFESLVKDALARVAGSITEHQVRVTVEPNLPQVYGDRIRLIEVIQNLIENAVKFLGEQAEPRIEIGMITRGDESVFYVADNGIGIEPRYYDKIFGLFERLDSTVEGTGVGLALVKRIIEVHGGRIWVESEGQKTGSRFCFTLPNQ